MKFRTAALLVFAFAAGVLVRDHAQDFTPQARACERNRENADRFGRALAHVLNGGSIYTYDVVASCRVKQLPNEVL